MSRAPLNRCRPALLLLLLATGCRRTTHNPPEPPEPVDAQHAVSSGELYNTMLLISDKCGSGSFLNVAQKVIVAENPTPGVIFKLRSDDNRATSIESYNLENARSLVALLRQQVSSSLESGSQQACVEQFADHLGRLVTAAENVNSR